MKTYDVSRLPSSITLGWDGENNWRPIAFDCLAMLFGHSDAAVTLWLLPNGESQAFPVALERDGDTVVWTPLNEEMTAERGQLQIVVQDSTDVGKSKVVDYSVHDSLVGGADHPAETPRRGRSRNGCSPWGRRRLQQRRPGEARRKNLDVRR